MRPYASHIIGLGDGNHEETIIRQCGTNPTKRLCEKLSTKEHQVLYLGYSWLLSLLFSVNGHQTRTLVIRGHHGWGGGSRTPGGDITKFSKDVGFWRADVFLYGHTHHLKMDIIEEGRVTGEHRWSTTKKYMLVCGTYQRTYADGPTTTYAERSGFNPTSLGHPKVLIRPTKEWFDIKVQH